MANEASVTVQATVLPDEISQIISGSISVSLAATNAGEVRITITYQQNNNLA